MLNHTHISIKNDGLVNCGKKPYIPKKPIHLSKENYLSEFKTELEKKKVLANLGISTTGVQLEWEDVS